MDNINDDRYYWHSLSLVFTFFWHWQRKEQTVTFEGLRKWFCLLNLSLFLLKLFSFSQENVLLGSDYPFPLGEPHPGKLIADVYKDNVELRVSTYGTVMHPVNKQARLTRYLLAELFAFVNQSLTSIVYILLQDKLLAGNALRFLGLDRSQFEDDAPNS